MAAKNSVTRFPLPSVPEGLEGERAVDFESSKLSYSFYFRGQPCLQTILNSRNAKLFAAYKLIIKDLDFAYAAFDRLIEMQEQVDDMYAIQGLTEHDHPDFVILKSLHQAGIISYGKCFASASGDGKNDKERDESAIARGVKLESSLTEKFDKTLQATHKVLIKQRNKYIAHGGATHSEKSYAYYVCCPKSDLEDRFGVTEVHAGAFHPDFYKNILALISQLKTAVDLIQQKPLQILREEVNAMTAEEQLAKTVFTYTVEITT